MLLYFYTFDNFRIYKVANGKLTFKPNSLFSEIAVEEMTHLHLPTRISHLFSLVHEIGMIITKDLYI